MEELNDAIEQLKIGPSSVELYEKIGELSAELQKIAEQELIKEHGQEWFDGFKEGIEGAKKFANLYWKPDYHAPGKTGLL